MTPLPPLDMAHTLTDQESLAHGERPERSRNARAQARHRAKRKAYIEQLEQTVTKLQTVLALSPDQVASLPPPLMRIRELEQENTYLLRENEDLRRQLEDKNAQLRPDISRRTTLPSSSSLDDRRHDRDIKRRRMLDQPDDIYMNTTTPHIPSPPPPLLIPPLSYTQQSSHSSSSSLNTSHRSTPSSMLTSYGISYHMPDTPSGSSTASSPSTQSFSPVDHYPTSMHSHHRSSSSSSNQTVLPSYSTSTDQFGIVKIEEDAYAQQHHGIVHSNGYSTSTLPSFHSAHHTSVGHWHAYSTDRS